MHTAICHQPMTYCVHNGQTVSFTCCMTHAVTFVIVLVACQLQRCNLVLLSSQDFRLKDSLIYTRAGRHLASLGKTKEIEQLLGCVRGLMKHEECDEVVVNCIRVMTGNPTLLREAESLIKLINSDSQKVRTLLELLNKNCTTLMKMWYNCIYFL